MPTRNQVRNATPRCPGCKATAGNWSQCGRLLTWNHEHQLWLCDKHGVIDHATQHATTPA